jgi:hypothetical protein
MHARGQDDMQRGFVTNEIRHVLSRPLFIILDNNFEGVTFC